ncbi:MAG: glutamate synthase subunit beta [Candidatus Aureabacteria bacterium]|nr:glutamate synthase subunit beta [Candidatus Auribacterota bacterium]
MADPRGFLKVKRTASECRPVCERIRDYKDVITLRSPEKSIEQASRCMDCGTPFCNWGCPIGNYIPEWNDYLFSGLGEKAFELLNSTNIMPEVTGRICPALCEYACVLGINDDPVTIRENELSIIEEAFSRGLVVPRPPQKRTGKKVAVIGSGPAGLSCAANLNRMGYDVTVFEKDSKIGGILRYGIPDFKLEKHILDRRVGIFEKEGISFRTNVEVGKKYGTQKMLKEFDALCLCLGSRVPRDLDIKGRNFKGIYFAMDYLCQQNRMLSGERPTGDVIDAKGKKVVVIGGGDTGSDCVGTANRQGASCVVQIEVMPKPDECRSDRHPWPLYPLILKTSSSHEEGGERNWSILTKEFRGGRNRVKGISCVRVEFSETENNQCPVMKEVKGSEFEIEAELVILAVGFVHVEHRGIVADLKLDKDKRGNIKTDGNYMTSVESVFAAGDSRRGQSLVVWAFDEGRKAAQSIHNYLAGDKRQK